MAEDMAMQKQAQAGRKAEVETSIQGEYSQRPTGVGIQPPSWPQSSTLPPYSYSCSCGTKHRAELLLGFTAQIRIVTVEAALFFLPLGTMSCRRRALPWRDPKPKASY